jgi:hypothetical protein
MRDRRESLDFFDLYDDLSRTQKNLFDDSHLSGQNQTTTVLGTFGTFEGLRAIETA